MSTTLVEKFKTEIVTIEPQGSVNALNAEEFKKELNSQVANHPLVLLDLHKIDFLDSAGLVAIVSSHRLAKSLGKTLAICSVSPQVKIVFELTQLDVVLDIFETREQFELSLVKG
jgi:anti-anti-sigma factor